MLRPAPSFFSQRGAASLLVTLVLLAAMLLALLYAQRDHLFEQRMAANQQRSTLAFEAAEAGLEWALAQLNQNPRIGADCLGRADAATSFRERYLRYDAATARFDGATWNAAGTATPLRAACVRGDAGWSCSCPDAAAATPALPAGPALAPAFSVQFAAGGKPGLVRVVSTGCTGFAGACAPGSTQGVDATARIEALAALRPGLLNPPSAPLTTLGAVLAGAAAFGAHHSNPATGGVAIHAGAAIDAAAARLTPPAGSSTAAARVEHDAALAALGPDGLFSALFGLSKAMWREQPAVTALACPSNCNAALAATLGDGVVNRLIAVRGDLNLAGPMSIGSTQRPVILVVDGTATFSGAVQVHGLVYARQVRWQGAGGPGPLVRGALVSEGSYDGSGTPDLVHEAAMFAALKGTTGSFVRVPGSWRDF